MIGISNRLSCTKPQRRTPWKSVWQGMRRVYKRCHRKSSSAWPGLARTCGTKGQESRENLRNSEKSQLRSIAARGADRCSAHPALHTLTRTHYPALTVSCDEALFCFDPHAPADHAQQASGRLVCMVLWCLVPWCRTSCSRHRRVRIPSAAASGGSSSYSLSCTRAEECP